MSQYENGVRVPPTETLMILADYYGVSMDYIMGRTDCPAVNRKGDSA
jgi:transcriptional regulator with XRE-family HTH domain